MAKPPKDVFAARQRFSPLLPQRNLRFLGGFCCLGPTPPRSSREPRQHRRHPPPGRERGFGVAEGLWEYPAPGRPRCSLPHQRRRFPAARGASIAAKHPPKDPRSLPRPGQDRTPRPSAHRVPRILRCCRRCLRPGRYSCAGIRAPRPARIPRRGGAAAPLFSSAAIVLQPDCSVLEGERGRRER